MLKRILTKHCHYEANDHTEMQLQDACFGESFMLFVASEGLAAISYSGICFHPLLLFVFFSRCRCRIALRGAIKRNII